MLFCGYEKKNNSAGSYRKQLWRDDRSSFKCKFLAAGICHQEFRSVSSLSQIAKSGNSFLRISGFYEILSPYFRLMLSHRNFRIKEPRSIIKPQNIHSGRQIEVNFGHGLIPDIIFHDLSPIDIGDDQR